MPKSDTWPDGVPMESFSNMDSAGSSDSVISMNSGYSEDSMELLSAEERECIMYFEETIESLEVQEDSGLSSDELHHGSQAGKKDHIRVHDISSLGSEGSISDQNSFLSEVPAAPPAPTALSTEGKTEHYALNQTSDPQRSPLIPESSAGFRVCSSAIETEVLGLAIGENANPESVTSTIPCPVQSTETSEIDLGLIPPPSDFMDEPDSPPQPEKVQKLPSVGISRKKPQTIDLEQVRQRASVKKTLISPVTPSKPPSDASPSLLTTSQAVASPPPEAAEPKSPPSVAPKPKKLPPNIILKSQMPPSFNGNVIHTVPTSNDRPFLDHQKIHQEALRKLGLLKSNEEVSGPALSPKLPPKAKTSLAASSPQVNPATLIEPPSTQSHTRFNNPPANSVTVQSLSSSVVLPSTTSTTLSVQPPDILPAPAAFSDPVGPSSSENKLSAVKDVTEAIPLTPPTLIKQLTPPKVMGSKSASLGRSDLGVSRYMTDQIFSEAGQGISGKQSPSELRNNRPRPASLGSRKAFSSAQGEGLEAGPAITKVPDSQVVLPSHTAFHHSRDSQKLPRSQGISVLICPRSDNEVDRREALKKLGLFRD